MVTFPKVRPLAAAAAFAGGAVAVAGCGGTPVAGSPLPPPMSTSVAPTATSVPQSSTAPPPASPRETASHEAPPKAKPVGWCTARDLQISANAQVSPFVSDRLFSISFSSPAKDGCMIGGSLSDVVFVAGGKPVPVEIGGGQDETYTEFRLNDEREVVVYIRTAGGPGAVQPSQIRFTLPGKGTKGDSVTLPWPGPFDGPIQVTNVVAPVG